MNLNRTQINWLWAILFALALGSSHLLDGPDELESQRLYQQELNDAKRMAAEEARVERAATEICVRLNGPGYTHRWTSEGQLRCVNTKGVPAAQLGQSV
jgi:hypothetical protein